MLAASARMQTDVFINEIQPAPSESANLVLYPLLGNIFFSGELRAVPDLG